MKADKLYLVGFMGAGKSTVARAMGRATGWRVEDIDERIEARERRSIASIFAQNGEPSNDRRSASYSPSDIRLWPPAAARSPKPITGC